MPNPDGTPTVDEQIKAAINAGQQSKSVSHPIGVPFYITDPNTGQPAVGPDGQPLRWGASGSTINSEDDLRYRGGRPGTRQITQTQPTYTLPRYFEGDEWLPAQLPPSQLASLQKKMVAAGLLKSGEAQLGVWDQSSMTAYMRLLGFANASGLDVASALDRWDAAHAADPNAGKAPLVKQVTSLDELRPAIRKAWMDTIGIGIPQDQVDHIATQFQNLQSGAQQQSYNAQDTGGTITAPPDAASFAAAQAREQNPLGAQEHDTLGFIDQFRQTLGGWSQ